MYSPHILKPAAWLLLAPLLGLGLVACSDSTRPGDGAIEDDPVPFEGGWSGDEFVLERVVQNTPDGRAVQLRLLGRNVQVDEEAEELSVDVAVRNDSEYPLFPSIVVGLREFDPAAVMPLNADRVLDSASSPDVLPGRTIWLYDYSDSLGGDGRLDPGETSARRTWTFSDPGLEAFSFAARVSFHLEPDRPTISGVVFEDRDRDGERDSDEPGVSLGAVQVRRPDGSEQIATMGPEGRWSLPVRAPGLYEVRFWPPPWASPLPFCLTTTNPLTVLLPPTPDGGVRSYEGADFGVDPEPCFPLAPPVNLRESRPDTSDVALDFYQLIDIGLRGDRYLRLRVGYSGCSDGHPLQLYAGSRFSDVVPGQTWALLSHDSRGELCAAYFEENVLFDLDPLRQRHRELFGSPGPFRLLFEDYQGKIHDILVR